MKLKILNRTYPKTYLGCRCEGNRPEQDCFGYGYARRPILAKANAAQDDFLRNPLGLRPLWPRAAFCLKTNTSRYSLFKRALLWTKFALSGAKIGFRIGSTLLISLGVLASAYSQEVLQQAREALGKGDQDLAIEILNTPSNEALKSSEAHFLLGLAYFQKGEPKKAVSSFEEAISLDEKIAKYHSMLASAKIQVAQGMNPMMGGPIYFAALGAYKKSVEIDPDHVPGHRGLVGYYSNAPAIAGGSAKKAQAHAFEIKRIDPVLGLGELAALAVKDKDFKAAHEFYDEAIQLSPNTAWIYFRKGVAYQMMDDEASAVKFFKLALEKNPDHQRAKDALDRLDQAAKSGASAPDVSYNQLRLPNASCLA